MYVKHLQEYLDKFTEGRNGMRGNAVSDARIYIMTSKGYLEEIKRIEVHESTNPQDTSIRVYHIYNQRQSQKQHKIGITTDQAENSENLSILKLGSYSRLRPVAKKISEADARHGIIVFLYSSQLHNYLYTQFQNPPAR